MLDLAASAVLEESQLKSRDVDGLKKPRLFVVELPWPILFVVVLTFHDR